MHAAGVAETDPLVVLPLAPGERVVRQGRAPVGAPWPSPRALLDVVERRWGDAARVLVGLYLLAIVAATLGPTRLDDALGVVTALMALLVFATPALLVAILALGAVVSRIGPFYVSICMLGLWGPAFAIFWTGQVSRHGWAGAVSRLGHDDIVAAAVFIGLPLARLVWGVTRRLHVTHVITSHQVAAVRAGSSGPRLLWARPVDDLRVERPWRAPGGCLVVGQGHDRRELHLVDDDPARLLEEVRTAREGT